MAKVAVTITGLDVLRKKIDQIDWSKVIKEAIYNTTLDRSCENCKHWEKWDWGDDGYGGCAEILAGEEPTPLRAEPPVSTYCRFGCRLFKVK